MEFVIIITAVLLIIPLGYAVRTRGRGKEQPAKSSGNALDTGGIIQAVIAPCRVIISRSLGSLAVADVIGVCKNYRTGADSLYSLRKRVRQRYDLKSNRESEGVYLNYMIEAAEKIAETTRHIIVSPSFRISISDKCEIQVLQKLIDKIEVKDFDLQAVADNKDFLEHLIARRSKSMGSEDFNDGAQAYSYLTMLFYLHTFINSYSRTINIYSNRSCDMKKNDMQSRLR